MRFSEISKNPVKIPIRSCFYVFVQSNRKELFDDARMRRTLARISRIPGAVLQNAEDRPKL